MAFTRNFVFSDPVAAQQAVQYAQLAAQEQAQRDQAFNDRMRTATQGNIAQQGAQQQMMLSQSQMAQRAAEAQKDRELARQGYTSDETIASGKTAQRASEIKAGDELAQQQARKQAEDLFNTGKSYADMLNNPNTPLTFRNKLMESGHVTLGPDGKVWIPRYPPPPPLPAGAKTLGQQFEHINSLRTRSLLQPGASVPVAPGAPRIALPFTGTATPVPSPGFTPQPTDFSVPISQLGGPLLEPSASGYEARPWEQPVY